LTAAVIGCGCGASSVRPQAPAEDGAQGGSPPVSLPTAKGEFELAGPYHHVPSGVSFPVRLGSFERAGGQRYAEGVDDFSFTYFAAGGDDGARVTAYVYPLDREPPGQDGQRWVEFLLKHLEGVAGAVQAQNDELQLGEPYGMEMQTRGRPLRWVAVELAYVTREARPQAMVSWAWVAIHGDWYVKLRMTGPRARSEEVRTLIAEFVLEFNRLIDSPGRRQP
jgi:hypothetical protein